MSITYPSPIIECDCDCEDCLPDRCEMFATEVQHDGDSAYVMDDGWYNVDTSPDDGEGTHYCPSCGDALGIDEEFKQ